MSKPLTQADIAKLICPPHRKSIQHPVDPQVPGLLIEVRHTGSKTYFLRYRDADLATRYHKIARSMDLSLSAVKKEALRLRSGIVLNNYPGIEKLEKQQCVTWNMLFERYSEYAAPRKKSFNDDLKLHTTRLYARYGERPIESISHMEVVEFHNELRSTLSASTANHYIRLMKRCFSLAVSWSLLASNPLTGISMFKEQSRETFLSPEQVKDLMAVLDQDQCRVPCLAVKMLLHTGLRKNSVLLLTWDCIDRRANTLSIRATNNKSGKLLTIPLNTGALSVLDELGTEHTSEYLFTNSKNSERLKSIDKVWQRLRKEAGLPHVRIHDLRHTFASMLINSGRSLYEVQRLIGHSSASVTTERYAHLTTKTLQAATDSVAEYLDSATD